MRWFERLALLGYGLLSYLALPWALWHITARARREAGYLSNKRERLGWYQGARPMPGQLVWLHAVSVGEVRAAVPLVQALLARGRAVLVTTMTPSGRGMSQELFGDGVMHATLPWDTPTAMRRFLAHFAPRLGVVMETEVWPNLMAASAARRLPMFLVNARLSDRSLAKAQRLAWLARPAYGRFNAVLAQSAADAQRLASIGASHTQVVGNLKFDFVLDADQLDVGRAQRSAHHGLTVVLASTRDDEERLLLNVMEPLLARYPDLQLVVVPRRPNRFDLVAEQLAEALPGLVVARRSQGQRLSAQCRVLLGDTMGEMAYYLGLADIVVVGGGWLRHGGSNLIEVCAAGCATVVGPHMHNFADAVAKALDAAAIIQLPGATALPDCLRHLIDDAAERDALGQNARLFAQAHQGACDRIMQQLPI
jgi:3-deoxy-D-manno-octulosonic-acid transferase